MFQEPSSEDRKGTGAASPVAPLRAAFGAGGAVMLIGAAAFGIMQIPGVSAVAGATAAALALVPVLYLTVYRPLARAASRLRRQGVRIDDQAGFIAEIVNNAGMPFYVVDDRGSVLYWNRACEALTGVSASRMVGVGEPWRAFTDRQRPQPSEVVLSGDVASLAVHYALSGRSGLLPGGLRAEGWHPSTGGKRRYLVFEAAPVKDRAGRPAAAVETIFDLTEAKTAEESFLAVAQGLGDAAGDDFFQALVVNLGKTLDVDYAFVGLLTRPDQRSVRTIAVYADGAIRPNFEYGLDQTPCETVVGKRLCSYPDEVQRLFPRDHMLVELGIRSYMGMPLISAGGLPLGLLVVLSRRPLTNERLTALMLQMFATRAAAELERSRADLELRSRTRQLSLLIEHLHAGIVFEDLERKVLLANAEFCRIFELRQSPDALVGLGPAGAGPVCPASFPEPEEFVRRMNEIAARGERVVGEVLRFGTDRVIERDYIPFFIDGVPAGHLWQYRDITAQRRMEADLHHAQKMEAVGQLAAGVAHDFKNILTAIIGHGALARMRIGEGDPLRHDIDQMLAAANRGTTLTQSLLAYSSREMVDPRAVNINEVIEKITGLLARLLGENIELKTVLTTVPLTIVCDVSRIEQLLMTLATHARNEMPGGGVLIIETESVEGDRECGASAVPEPGRRHALITVADSGSVADDHGRSRMVEPVVPAGEQRKDPDLGLALVYGIVQQHKGRMSVTRGSEGGAVFRICLPLAPPAEEASQALSLPAIRGGDETILVAEDDEVVRTLLAQALTEFGYRVVLAVDGEDAVRKYMEHRDEIALMVLDVLMPRKNGREVYDKIRIFNAGAKAIFMSGYTGELLQEQGIRSGGPAFLPKPVQITDLLRKIRDVLDSGPSAPAS